jgi:endonuclease YncB( thermonuclease family)
MACGGEIFARGTASRVIDGRTFVLNDGREVRLAAIEIPALPLPQDSGAASGGAAARDALASLLAGTEVVLRQTELQNPTATAGSSPLFRPCAMGSNARCRGI